MKLLFMGSGELGLPTLQRLMQSHDVVGVITSPNRPAGRKLKKKPTAIGEWASMNSLNVVKTSDVNSVEMISMIDSLEVDAVVVIAFGQKLSEKAIGERRAINLHASLLPKWRGASPINAAIVNGDSETGVSVITLAQQMDAGIVLGQSSLAIDETETAGELHDRLSMLGPDLVMEVLAGDFSGEKQDETQVTYAPKLSRKDSLLDLTQSADVIARRIRGLSPWPGCHLTISGIDCKIIRAIPNESKGEVGEILSEGSIAVGSGSIEILQLRPSGGKSMSWKDFCNGRSIQVGDMCGVQS